MPSQTAPRCAFSFAGSPHSPASTIFARDVSAAGSERDGAIAKRRVRSSLDSVTSPSGARFASGSPSIRIPKTNCNNYELTGRTLGMRCIPCGAEMRVAQVVEQDLAHEGGRIRPPKDGMRRMSKDRATAGFQRRQKAGNLYSDPWTLRPGGGMIVCNEFGEVDQ